MTPGQLVKWCGLGGNYKANYDRSVKTKINKDRIGVIVHDHQGLVIAVLSEGLRHWVNVDCVEAMVAFKAVQFVKDLGLENIYLESDTTNVIKMINDPGDAISQFGHLAHGVHDLLRRFRSTTVYHVFRKDNSVTHCLSILTFDCVGPMIWMDEASPTLVHLILSEGSQS
ncbi:uncharacterized protein LOC114275176 [Camellia sinensis]|uniref:uncharacterized protein LOC114275176 n=1 Tax=Camellia sinensis TaxID=4442 RepID=UPI001036867C|nr:uncharacterized protein LOC114275176 [Camellia sinensis]